MNDVTRLLNARSGPAGRDRANAAAVYDELRRIAHEDGRGVRGSHVAADRVGIGVVASGRCSQRDGGLGAPRSLARRCVYPGGACAAQKQPKRGSGVQPEELQEASRPYWSRTSY
jgi:hypothetical protein